jgi:hypothetical protein
MNDSALQWLMNRASPPGTLGCGLRRPDGNCVCHSVEEAFPAATLERILGCFDQLALMVFTELPGLRWSTWAFEQGQIRFVERQDGWRLALVVRAESEAVSFLDPLSLEFLSLPLGSE